MWCPRSKSRWSLPAGALLGLLTAGCAGLRFGPPPEVVDPPWLAPRCQPLFTPLPSPAGPGPRRQVPPPSTVPPAEGTAPVPGTEETIPSEGPELIPQTGVSPESRLELDVEAPERVGVGGRVTFSLELTNRGTQTARDVVVLAEFDEALIFPGRPEKRVRREVGHLAAEQSREFALTLTGKRTGRHCARLTVMAAGEEALWKSVCVRFVAEQADGGS